MSTFTWIPDQGASAKRKPNVEEAKFGDGYSQRSADAINHIDEEWSLSFTLRPKTEVTAIDDFLTARNGVERFDWTTPRGDARKCICKDWSAVYNHDGDCSITCTFNRVFES